MVVLTVMPAAIGIYMETIRGTVNKWMNESKSGKVVMGWVAQMANKLPKEQAKYPYEVQVAVPHV